MPGAGDADGFAKWAIGEDCDGVDVGDGGHVVEGAGVDVPGVVLLRCVVEGLELVAAGVGGEGFGWRSCSYISAELGNAAGLLVYAKLNVGICKQVVVRGLIKRKVVREFAGYGTLSVEYVHNPVRGYL